MNFVTCMKAVVSCMKANHVNNAYTLLFSEDTQLAIIWCHIEDGNDSCHKVMNEIYTLALNELNYPVSVFHNDPTDGQIHVLDGKHSSASFDPNTCCKASYRYSYDQWVQAARPAWFSTKRTYFYKALDAYIKGMGYTVDQAFDEINWDTDPTAWLLNQMASVFTD